MPLRERLHPLGVDGLARLARRVGIGEGTDLHDEALPFRGRGRTPFEQGARALAEAIGPLRPGQAWVLALASGIGEEALFRGALQPVVGLWLATLLFALAHFVPGAKISEVHGTVLPWGERVLYPLYHPAAALRGRALRETFLADARRLPGALA